MARKFRNASPPAKEITIQDLRIGIDKLDRRIDELRSFDVKTITERFDAKIQAITDRINNTLADIFGHGTVEYSNYSVWSLDTLPVIVDGYDHSLTEVQEAYKKGIDGSITKLSSLHETLKEKLEYLELNSGKEISRYSLPGNRQVFIVHGSDELLKQTVARFVTQLDLSPVILHEQPNKGKTIIEKIESYSNVDFAIVLLTPDDIAYPVNDLSAAKPRARQNVILELGFFLGILGRERVCALYKSDVDIPSDYEGVIYIKVNENDDWRLKLAKEIKCAGIDINMNKV